ncbi:MAG: hypothetical protein EXR59_02375 [Dehalococcoidia bacterium]|nr:hypothetical protein [Dehalococcoidia bacterium]
MVHLACGGTCQHFTDQLLRPGYQLFHETYNRRIQLDAVAICRRDQRRRVAKAGYVATAPDLMSPIGGTAAAMQKGETPEQIRTILPETHMKNMLATLEFLKSLPSVRTDRIGCTGFCFGGGITFRFLTATKDVKAAVPYYGIAPPLEDVHKINASVHAMYAENSARINASLPPLEQAMKEHHKSFMYQTLAGAGHAFNNDGDPNYNAEAAEEAWKATIKFFDHHLKN